MYKVILNPTSGRGQALKKMPEIEALLSSRGLDYSILIADSPEDATRLAQEASEACVEGIIAVGGDGTLFQIINGITNSNVPLLFAPCGTGNDFIKSLNLPEETIAALRLQLDAAVTRIDVGRMNDIQFLNVSGTGFDVDVLRYAEKYKQKYSGLLPYLLGLIEAIKTYKPTSAWISIDGQPEELERFAILSIGNGKYFGGGMKAVPDAEVNDGMFDVVIVKPVKKLAIIPLIAFYIAGKHISMKLARVKRCKRISIRCEGMTINLDGELRDANAAHFEILPGKISVRIPGM